MSKNKVMPTGRISIGDINTEIGTSGRRSLGAEDGRDMVGIPSGEIALSDFQGASWVLLDYVDFVVEYTKDDHGDRIHSYMCYICALDPDGNEVRGSSSWSDCCNAEQVRNNTGCTSACDDNRKGYGKIYFDPPVRATHVRYRGYQDDDHGDDDVEVSVTYHLTDGRSGTAYYHYGEGSFDFAGDAPIDY